MTVWTLLEEPGGLGPVWRLSAGSSNAFLGEAWLSSWLATSGSAPLLLDGRNGSGEPERAGFLCRSLERRLGGLVRARRWSLNISGDPSIDTVFLEYNGLLGAPAGESAPLLDALAFLHEQEGWDELHLHGLEAPVADAIGARWPRHRIVWQAPTFRIDLDALREGGGDISAMLSRNSRQQVRRALRLLGEEGPLSVRAAANATEGLAFLERMKALHIHVWGERGHEGGAFANPYFETFHRHMIANFLETGAVELLKISCGEREIGYLHNFIAGGHVHNYQCGFATESDNRIKPGIVSHVLAIGHHLERGAAIYDFLAGEQRYKASLARPGPDLRSLVLWRPRPALLAEQALRRLKDRWTTWRDIRTGGRVEAA
ncbi:MAG: GNAT family N-acetyltransferase [Geminicoccaceae bacterium]